MGAADGGRGRGVWSHHPRKPGVSYPVLVPNEQGTNARRAAGVGRVAVFTAASEAFNLKNINASIDQSLELFRPVLARANADGVARLRLPPCSACPYQGRVPRRRGPGFVPCSKWLLRDLARRHHRRRHAGTGARDAQGGRRRSADGRRWPCTSTIPTARRWRTCWPRLEEGVAVVDSAVSGAGGCPYAKGATGNVASEDVVYMLHGLGIRTGIDLDALAETGRWLAGLLGRDTGSRVGKALAA